MGHASTISADVPDGMWTDAATATHSSVAFGDATGPPGHAVGSYSPAPYGPGPPRWGTPNPRDAYGSSSGPDSRFASRPLNYDATPLNYNLTPRVGAPPDPRWTARTEYDAYSGANSPAHSQAHGSDGHGTSRSRMLGASTPPSNPRPNPYADPTPRNDHASVVPPL